MRNKDVEKYIEAHLMECTRVNYNDEDTLIGLPYPYSVPCPDHFQELYYWDTYFINLGLIEKGHLEQALNNVNDFFFLIEKYGFVPNASRTYYLDRSQPPFLSMMVKDIFDRTRDLEWLNHALTMLCREHSFWMTKRMTSCGLNQYGSEIPESTWNKRFQIMQNRTGQTLPEENKHAIARTSHANVESGWDCTPRFEFDAENYVQVDLNSLLYLQEKNIAFFASQLGHSTVAKEFQKLAENRCELMNRLLWCEEKGAYMDWNFGKGHFSPVLSGAGFFPLFAGVSDRARAERTAETLLNLEYPHGISACEKNSISGRYQWSYPNAWAPVQYIAVRALQAIGKHADAKRIAEKYISTVDDCFEKTGRLWEKYNAVDGSINVISEKTEQMPVMLGWTAGVYIWFRTYMMD